MIEYRSARSFVYAAALHSYKSVFYDIGKSYTVCSAEFVEFSYNIASLHFHAVHRYRNAFVKGNRYVSSLIRSLFGSNSHLQNFVVHRLVCRVFKVKTFMRKVPYIFVFAVICFSVDFKRNIVRFSVVYFLVARFDVPNSPRRDYLHIRSKRFDSQFESDLVVALSSTAVANRVRAFFERNLYDSLSDNGSCKRRAEHVLILINSARFYGRKYVIVYEFVRKIFYIQLARACLNRFFFKAVKFRSLPNVAAYCDNFAVVIVFFEPRNNNGRVQTARICQNNFLNISHFTVSFYIDFYYISIIYQLDSKIKYFFIFIHTFCNFLYKVAVLDNLYAYLYIKC